MRVSSSSSRAASATAALAAARGCAPAALPPVARASTNAVAGSATATATAAATAAAAAPAAASSRAVAAAAASIAAQRFAASSTDATAAAAAAAAAVVRPPATHAQKCAALKEMLTSKDLKFIMEGHNGLSAKIVEEAGFDGIWGSGLSISAAMGVRDNNEASYTQVLEVMEFMSDATNVPILLDGDTGYGNYNNARILVRKLEQRGIAGVCIEDKLFPKTNSLLGGKQDSQPLADVEEFALKIRAMKETQTDPNFCVVARVEAFIANWPLEEALRRAEAYRVAGADAILMHSKKADCSEIDAFMEAWGDRLPVVIVPTKYYKTDTDHFRKIGISLVIWANHNMRASIAAMRETSAEIFNSQSLVNVEPKVASVAEVFALQNNDELIQADDKYLPKK